MRNVFKYEESGMFLLSWMPECEWFNDDLGRGSAVREARFFTEEGRTYFMQAEQGREIMGAKISQLESDIRFLKTVRGANQNLREVRAANRRTDETK